MLVRFIVPFGRFIVTGCQIFSVKIIQETKQITTVIYLSPIFLLCINIHQFVDNQAETWLMSMWAEMKSEKKKLNYKLRFTDSTMWVKSKVTWSCGTLCVFCRLHYKSARLSLCFFPAEWREIPHNIKAHCPEIQFASIVLHVWQQKRLTRFYCWDIIPHHQTNKTPSAATEQAIGLDGGVKGAGCPWAASRAAWNHRSSHDRAAGAQGSRPPWPFWLVTSLMWPWNQQRRL